MGGIPQFSVISVETKLTKILWSQNFNFNKQNIYSVKKNVIFKIISGQTRSEIPIISLLFLLSILRFYFLRKLPKAYKYGSIIFKQ